MSTHARPSEARGVVLGSAGARSLPVGDAWAPARRPGPWASGRLDIEGHRGARGLVVENTLPSFLAAFESGVTAVELDVRLTADGHVVVWHDSALRPNKCMATAEDLVGARVDELTLAQLRTVDVGALSLERFPEQRTVPGTPISTLAELLAACATDETDSVWWTIEVKVDPTDPREVATRERLVHGTLEAVHDAGLERRCFVHSFDWAVLERSADLAPSVLRSALAIDGVTYSEGSAWLGSLDWREHGANLASAVAALDAAVVSPHFSTVDAAFTGEAHARGLAVLPWTVNDPDDLLAMVDAGVDGIVTDYPDRAVDTVGRVIDR